MTSRLRVLVVDDEPIVGHRLDRALTKIGCEVESHVDPQAALDRLAEQEFDIVVTDIRMDPVDGIQLLERVHAARPGTIVILITGYAMMSLAREAMRKGAFDFISKPFKPDEIREVIRRAAAQLGRADQLSHLPG